MRVLSTAALLCLGVWSGFKLLRLGGFSSVGTPRQQETVLPVSDGLAQAASHSEPRALLETPSATDMRWVIDEGAPLAGLAASSERRAARLVSIRAQGYPASGRRAARTSGGRRRAEWVIDALFLDGGPAESRWFLIAALDDLHARDAAPSVVPVQLLRAERREFDRRRPIVRPLRSPSPTWRLVAAPATLDTATLDRAGTPSPPARGPLIDWGGWTVPSTVSTGRGSGWQLAPRGISDPSRY